MRPALRRKQVGRSTALGFTIRDYTARSSSSSRVNSGQAVPVRPTLQRMKLRLQTCLHLWCSRVHRTTREPGQVQVGSGQQHIASGQRLLARVGCQGVARCRLPLYWCRCPSGTNGPSSCTQQ